MNKISFKTFYQINYHENNLVVRVVWSGFTKFFTSKMILLGVKM